jgi:hypothetical protein
MQAGVGPRARLEREAREREDRLDLLPFTLREAARAVDDGWSTAWVAPE